MPPVTQALLITNVAVFLLQSATGGLLEAWFALWPPGHGFGIWQLLTYGFLHGGLAHIFFNMFALYMFGSDIERLFGARYFLAYYLACVVSAALGRTDLSADPDAGADLRDRVRRARARARGHRHRGGRGALRAPRRNARGLARDSVPPPGFSFYSAALTRVGRLFSGTK